MRSTDCVKHAGLAAAAAIGLLTLPAASQDADLTDYILIVDVSAEITGDVLEVEFVIENTGPETEVVYHLEIGDDTTPRCVRNSKLADHEKRTFTYLCDDHGLPPETETFEFYSIALAPALHEAYLRGDEALELLE